MFNIYDASMKFKIRFIDDIIIFTQNFCTRPHNFPETSIHRIVVLPKCDIAESFFRRKIIAEGNLTESSHGQIVKLAKLHNAKRHFRYAK